VLAGDIRTGSKGHLPNQFVYVAGFDAGVSKTFTFAFDILGQDTRNAQRLRQSTFVAANRASFSQIAFQRDSLHAVNGSADSR